MSDCETCFDTETIDFGGREIPCPNCQNVTVTIKGLAHALGDQGRNYSTAATYSPTHITFEATSYRAILRDVALVETRARSEAKRQGLKGRNYISSGAIAISDRVRKAIKES